MITTNVILDDDTKPLLLDDKNCESLHKIYYRPVNAAIVKGVMSHVSAWPSHLFATFITGCFIFSAFIIFVIVDVIFHTSDFNEFYRKPRIIDSEEYPSVYFMKHVSKNWSREQFCNIESTARDYPDIKVHLINLLAHDFAVDSSSTLNTSNPFRDANSEDVMRRALGMTYKNVRNVDITVQALFKKSVLSQRYGTLNIQMLEAAARAQLLWQLSGIILDPTLVYQLNYLKQYICRPANSCVLPYYATMNIEGSIQASGFPCNAFLGYFINVLATSELITENEIIEETYRTYCPKQINCTGIKILPDDKSREAFTMVPMCPVISQLSKSKGID